MLDDWDRLCAAVWAEGWGRVLELRLTEGDRWTLENALMGAQRIWPGEAHLATLTNPVFGEPVPVVLAEVSEAVLLLPSSVRKNGHPRKNARWEKTVLPLREPPVHTPQRDKRWVVTRDPHGIRATMRPVR